MEGANSAQKPPHSENNGVLGKQLLANFVGVKNVLNKLGIENREPS